MKMLFLPLILSALLPACAGAPYNSYSGNTSSAIGSDSAGQRISPYPGGVPLTTGSGIPVRSGTGEPVITGSGGLQR
jgi:hypothetical protein